MNIMKIYYKRRAVSPVLAAILLIGLAVAAAAVLFVVVLPMIGGTAKVEFVSATADDRNSDGLLDQITVKVSNSGAAADEFAEGTISISGWSAAANIEIPLATPTDIIFKTTDVGSQIEEDDTLSITLAFDSTADIAITQTDVDMDHSATLTESDMLIDFTDTAGTVSKDNTNATVQKWWGTSPTAGADATHSGTAGLRIRTDIGNPISWFSWVKSTVADGTAYGTANNHDNQLTDTLWTKNSLPVVSFWVKSDRLFTATNFRIYLESYDGSTEQGLRYYDIDTNYLETGDGYIANTWTRVILNAAEWGSYTEADELNAATGGWFAFYVDNDMGNDWDIYIDDISVHAALT